VITNGLDAKTREAIRYWRSTGLDIRPWVYRVYPNQSATDSMYLEMSAFRVDDNPYEDLAEGYYILNTNFSNDPKDHEDLLTNAKAAAYYDPWKFKIERLTKGDIVFLYQSGVGIVAFGKADGKLVKCSHDDEPDEEYFRKLQQFQQLLRPLSAAEIKSVTGVNHIFMGTMFGIDVEAGKKIEKYLYENKLIKS
jgi:hypothetical protein